MIAFSHVYKTYPGPNHALKNVDISIDKGEFVFLTGPSGAGKTTLFRLLTAYTQPTSGEVRVAAHNIESMTGKEIPFLRRKLGVVFQDFKLLNDRTVYENVGLPLLISGDSGASYRSQVDKMLEQVGLKFRGGAYPEQLSGGEQQRVAIARALVHRPEILIADEPTGNLDPEMSQEIIDLFVKANAQGTTVFIATHDLDLVYRLRKRVIQIKGGMVERDQ